MKRRKQKSRKGQSVRGQPERSGNKNINHRRELMISINKK
jgi:hypothetical protein